MAILITGGAGFIGSTLAHVLLDRGDEVIALDNLNDYYDVNLKMARLKRLEAKKGFSFHKVDISDKAGMEALFADKLDAKNITGVVNLAAQAGVRYSLTNPYAYIETNVMGQVVVMEMARKLPNLKHFVFASSSSVYGGNTKVPFSVEDRVEKPVPLYAATKKMDELMAYTYAHIYGLPSTGLRFFTVYGPWGRPDMALYIFTKNIFEGKPIPVFNNGQMKRDFTYIDDIVDGVVRVLDKPPVGVGADALTRVYNIGNSRSEALMDYIHTLEEAIGKKAICDFLPMQAGDVPASFADIEATTRDFGYKPTTSIDVGVPKFVEWYRAYEGV